MECHARTQSREREKVPFEIKVGSKVDTARFETTRIFSYIFMSVAPTPARLPRSRESPRLGIAMGIDFIFLLRDDTHTYTTRAHYRRTLLMNFIFAFPLLHFSYFYPSIFPSRVLVSFAFDMFILLQGKFLKTLFQLSPVTVCWRSLLFHRVIREKRRKSVRLSVESCVVIHFLFSLLLLGRKYSPLLRRETCTGGDAARKRSRARGFSVALEFSPSVSGARKPQTAHRYAARAERVVVRACVRARTRRVHRTRRWCAGAMGARCFPEVIPAEVA